MLRPYFARHGGGSACAQGDTGHSAPEPGGASWRCAAAIVAATTFHDDPGMIAKVSRGLGEAMVGINVDDIPEPHRLAQRGW